MPVMTDRTPYSTRPASEVARERECMRSIFASASYPETIWEAFGGVGVTGQVLHERFPRAVLVASELDLQCTKNYNELGIGVCRCMDARQFYQEVYRHGTNKCAVSLDFNRLSLLDVRGRPGAEWKVKLLGDVLQTADVWVQVTITGSSHMHLHWQKYDLPRPDLGLYIEAFGREVQTRWNRRLVAHASHYSASYLLFED